VAATSPGSFTGRFAGRWLLMASSFARGWSRAVLSKADA
jgi:hypothetical protein